MAGHYHWLDHVSRVIHCTTHHVMPPVAIPTATNAATHTQQEQSSDEDPVRWRGEESVSDVCGFQGALTKHTNMHHPTSVGQ